MDSYNTARYQTTGSWLAQNSELIRGKVLDVGCGDKPYHRLFHENEWMGLDGRPVGDIQADMHEIPLEDESFDTVLCTDVLHWTLEPMRAMREMWRVLKPGGYLIVITPCTMPKGNGMAAYQPEALARMASALSGRQESAAAGFGLFKTEVGALRKRSKFAGGWSPEIQGWVDSADERFPVVSIVSAMKG